MMHFTVQVTATHKIARIMTTFLRFYSLNVDFSLYNLIKFLTQSLRRQYIESNIRPLPSHKEHNIAFPLCNINTMAQPPLLVTSYISIAVAYAPQHMLAVSLTDHIHTCERVPICLCVAARVYLNGSKKSLDLLRVPLKASYSHIIIIPTNYAQITAYHSVPF